MHNPIIKRYREENRLGLKGEPAPQPQHNLFSSLKKTAPTVGPHNKERVTHAMFVACPSLAFGFMLPMLSSLLSPAHYTAS